MNIRRFIVVLLALAAGVLLLTSYTEKRRQDRPSTPTQPAPAIERTGKNESKPSVVVASPTEKTPDKPIATPKTTAGRPKWEELRGHPGRKYTIGSIDPRNKYLFQVELVSDGAAINAVRLSRYFFTVDDTRLAEDDWDAYQKARKENPVKYRGPYSLLNSVDYGGKCYLPLATRQLKVTLPDKSWTMWPLHKMPWYLESHQSAKANDQGETISFAVQFFMDANHGKADSEADYRPALKVIKTYVVRPSDYTIDISLRVENLWSQPLEVSIDQSGPTGVPREGYRADMRKAAYGKLLAEGNKVQTIFKQRQTDDEKFAERADKIKKGQAPWGSGVGTSAADEPVLWIGQINKFFGSMMYLVPPEKSGSSGDKLFLNAPELAAEFYTEDVYENETSTTHVTGVRIPKLEIQPGNSGEIRFELFTGPKKREMFVDEGAEYFRPHYKELDYISTIELRSCFCAWDWLSLRMIQFLQILSKVTFGNYGLAIIVLVILVRLALHPLTKKGQVAMAGMKKLAPLMKELEKKYANDKEALNRERVKLYK